MPPANPALELSNAGDFGSCELAGARRDVCEAFAAQRQLVVMPTEPEVAAPRPFDSSKTRVVPVFDRLAERDSWVADLLALPGYGAPDARTWHGLDLRVVRSCWGAKEERLPPPAALLSWLVRNPGAWGAAPDTPERHLLAAQDPATVAQALDSLTTRSKRRAWYLLEGPTAPDAYIETPDAVVVVEGKRTESGPTEATKWMPGRHQMWRHIDAAWERAGHRQVFGFFIVEGTSDGIPDAWRTACANLLSAAVRASSFPHRGNAEIQQISRCFLGVTTWQRVCATFGISYSDLPNTVAGA